MAADATGTFEGFGPDLVELYEGLAADSSTACWDAHRSVYDEQVGGPAKPLAVALKAELGPVKAFRPHRDVRFSDDKTPYETNVSVAGGRDGAGTYYFSASPDGVDPAGGLYQPSKDQLHRFRRLQDDERRADEMDALLADLDGEGFSMMEAGALESAACLEQVALAWRSVGRWDAWLESRVGVPLEVAGPSGTSAPR